MMDIQNSSHIGYWFNNVSPYNRVAMREAYSELSRQQRPTALLTLTVKEPNSPHAKWQVPDSTLLRNVNKLLYWVNIKMFGGKFMKKGLGLMGFGCIEKQANYQPHVHMAITSGVPLEKFFEFQNVVFEKAQKISLFDKSGIDLQSITASDADYTRVGDYLAKGGRMLMLGADGLY